MVSDRIQDEEDVGNDEDVHIVSDLMDDIRDAVTDYQVSTILKLSLRSSIEPTGLDDTAAGHL